MKIHLEFEGSEAHHFVEEYEGFIDDVATRRIDRRDPNKVVDTFVILQVKGKIIAAQDYMIKIIPGNKKSNPSKERLNT